jgi:hypothetical protein
VLETLNPLVKNTMKRLSLEELKAKAGKNVITQLEAIKGGEADYPPFPVAPCDRA